MRKKKVERKFFTDQQKLQIVTEVLEGRITKEEARYKYDIPGNCSVLYWKEKRIKSINKISDKDLIPVRDECLTELDRQVKRKLAD